LAANISGKLVPTTFINTYMVSQIPICKMDSQILALFKGDWYFKYQLILQIPIGTSNTMSNDPSRRRTTTRITRTTRTTTKWI
jgi:hypothetical protein